MACEIKDLYKSFGDKQVINGLSFSLEPGGLYLLRGPSGSGKTTLLHILMGLHKPDSGTVPAGLRYSAVFQENRLLPRRSAVGNIKPVLYKPDSQTIRELLSRVLPEDSLDKPAEELSGGMQRRVAIVRAMAAESECVILDEPFTGLDAETVANTLDFILQEQRGRTLIIATHQDEYLEGLSPVVISL